MSYSIPSVLTVAGSDSSGGAGIQADIKTVESMGLYAQSVITALTAQNTLGVYGVFDVAPDFVCAQMDAVFGDIRPQAVKVGMVSSTDIVSAVARGLSEHAAPNVVFDPVMVSTSGSRLISQEAKDALVRDLFPLATIITPNIPEAEVLCGMAIETPQNMESAARILSGMTPGAVLVKGGHGAIGADDPAVSRGVVSLAERQARRNGEYARNRLHAVERNSVWARIGKRSFRSSASGETLRFRGSSRRFRHGEGKRAARSHVGASRSLWLA